MIGKIVDVLTELFMDLFLKTIALSGVYATYKLIFLDIPPLAVAIVITVIILVSWAATVETPKQDAIPVTIIPGNRANATMISVPGGE